MEYFHRDMLRALAETQTTPCVSLFMPVYRAEATRAQDRIRLKNLLKQTRNQLKEAGHEEAAITTLLQPLQQLTEQESWGTLGDGLAAFLSPDDASIYRVPLDLEEMVVVAERFHLKPLFPLIASNNAFYLLALSKNQVKLFQGSHQGLNEIQTDEIPSSIEEALFYDDPEQSVQHHTGNRAVGRHDAVFHGQGVQDDDKRSRPHDEMKRFFRHIDNGVKEVLQGETAPLLLAGVEEHLPIYQTANSYPHLIETEVVAGNADHLSAHELHKKAWAVIEPIFMKAQQDDVERYKSLDNSNGLSSSDLKEIIPAAAFRRIETLFVPIGQHVWGRYDAESNTVTLHDEQEQGDEDLLNFAAVQTYLNGGTVHALRPENMPAETSLAATFRFPAQVEAVEQ